MGAGWYIAGEESGRTDLPHGGKALLFAQYHLENFAGELGVTPLKDFFSSNPEQIAAYLQSQGVTTDQFDLPDEEWYEPADALVTVRALITRLDEDPGPVQTLHKVREDLAAIGQAVEAAQARGERFHIGTSMPDLSGREPGEK
jgi:hypothetical protein